MIYNQTLTMRNFMALKVLLALTISLNLTSCKKGGDKNSSRATGWKINAKEGGFQYNTNFKEQETPPGTVFVEGGTFTMGKVQDDVMHDWNNSPNQQHVQSFYMDETEVTNLMYLEYLDWIKRVFPPDDENYRNIYNGVIPDTLVWRNRLGYNEVMTKNYLRHPAYREYPVVGVSWIQAVEYASWRSDRVNEHILEKEGYLKEDARYTDTDSESIFSTEAYINNPTASYGGKEEVLKGGKRTSKATDSTEGVFANRESGVLQPNYRLPTEAEWEYAALGLVGIRSYNVYRGRKKYPWDGLYTRSGKRKIRGDQKANFKQGDGDYGGIAGWSDDGADITNAVKSYEPNDYGLYDMAGNVAEWVADVYRPIVDDEFNDFNYYRGNVYMKNKIGEDGKVVLVTVDSITYDTLDNGKIIARNFPGEVVEVEVDDNETYLRTNFNKSDHKNFRDGDKQSTRYFESFGDDDDVGDPDDSGNMYNAPKHKIEVDSATNSMTKTYDESGGTGRTSLINDKVRVYKGGSWKDRAYWLDPAQRRYYPQDMATDYIGFRCAMSRVGSKSKDRKRPRN